MQAWTPLNHVRAIGAWPQPSLSTWSKRLSLSKHSANNTLSHIERYATNTKSEKKSRGRKFEIQINGSSLRDSKSYLETDLPLPPFLRDSDHANRVEALKTRHRNKNDVPRDIYIGHNQRTRAQNEREAPFSTAFAENPYAKALAEPVREDRFSSARLPISCLLDFHLAEQEEEAGRDGSSETNSADSTTQEAVEVAPLSLAAELVPRNKNPEKLVEGEKLMVEAWDSERTSWAPQGSASYIMGKRSAIDYVTLSPGKRVRGMVLSRRVLSDNRHLRFDWRQDMGDFVLQSLRRIVLKRLGWVLRNKKTADRPGLATAMPGLAGLERLDSVANVMCVLRLRPKGWQPENQEIRPDVIETRTETPDNPVEGPEKRLSDGLDPTIHDEPYDGRWSPSFISPSLADAVSEGAIGSNIATKISERPRMVFPNAAQAHRQRELPSEKSKPFLTRITTQPPVPLPSSTYYPTIPYLNRRVPGYNLPYLLGTEALEELVGKTVFDNCEYVAITGHLTTVSLQIWLLKLASYVHGSKSEEMMI